MIISKIVGGLGNQLFMYAAGRRLAHAHQTDLKLDVSEFSNYKLYSYELSNFNIIENIALHSEIENFKGKYQLQKILSNYLSYNVSLRLGIRYIREWTGDFDFKILDLPNNVYLHGYWQSEKYFKDIRNVLLEELTFKNQPNKENSKYIKLIENTNSVAVHIRRGDYVNNPITRNKYNTLDIEYYQNCTDEISKRIMDPYFFIFSNDPDWVQSQIRLQYPNIHIYHNKNPHEDMRLMSLCKHQIIANSTFSWWAAWINSNPNKIVIAPAKWFMNSKRNSKNLIPTNWCQI